MAEFRKMLYAFAVVALLAAFTVPASAQGLVCTEGGSTNQTVRFEGYAELAGDIVMKCVQALTGISTPPDQPVPNATIRVTLASSTFTSRQTGSGTPPFSEALLLIDEPGAPGQTNPGFVGQLYCGASGNDLNGVCNITAPASADNTYDGNPSGLGTGSCSAGAFGCGRPNIFQGRQVSPNAIEFPGVPLDPPGTGKQRTIRITNLRVNATVYDPDALVASQIEVFLSFEGSASVALPNNKFTIGNVRRGMGTTTVTSNSNFTVCIGTTDESQTQSIVIREGFLSAWKPRNRVQFTNDATAPTLTGPYSYDGSASSGTLASGDIAQNLPGVRIFSEGGFYQPGWGSEHGINGAGRADQGTQLSFTVGATPSGVSLSWPATADIYLGSTGSGTVSGFAVLTSAGTTSTATTVTYEVAFDDPSQLESLNIVPTVNFTLPASNGATSASSATFTPFFPAVGDSSLIPRFKQTASTGNQSLFSIGNCNCSLLFPWVISSSVYTTGIAVSNTSKDPTNAMFSIPVTGYNAVQQSGEVRLFLFGTNAAGSTVVTVGPTSNPAGAIPSGTSATFIVGGISGGFAGYAIAKADFQYCHGMAFLFSSTSGIPPATYLGLVMDHGRTLLPRTEQAQSDQLQQ